MRTSHLLSIIGAIAIAAPAWATSPVEQHQSAAEQSHQLIPLGAADSTAYTDLIRQYYEDQFRHSQDPLAPYFLLMSKGGSMAMGVGGQIKLTAAYDFDGSIDGMGFAPYSIVIPADPSGRTAFQTSAAGTSLFFTIFGSDSRFGRYQIYIQADFKGYGHRDMRLKKAYATVGDWTLGYAKSTFSDPAAQPTTIDSDGPNSRGDNANLLLRYLHEFSSGIAIGASAETPDYKISTTAQYSPTKVYSPAVAAIAQYQWNKGQHVRLAGIVRPMRYRDLVDNQNHSIAGWGIHASTVFRPIAPLTLMGAAVYGHGIGSIVNDLRLGNYDLIGVASRPGTMYAPASFGWYAAAQYHYSPNLFSTVIFSNQRFLPHNAIYGPDQYRAGWYATANTFWNITPRCCLGAEFNVGHRQNIDRTARYAYRLSALAQLSF